MPEQNIGNNESYFVLFLIYLLSYFLILIIGIIVGILAIWRYFRKKESDWIEVIKKKSEFNLKPGLIGFFIIGIGLMMMPLLIEIPIAILFINGIIDYMMYLVLLIISFSLLFILLFFLGKVTEYNQKN